METKEEIQLTDPEFYPDEPVIQSVLGEAYPTFQKLLDLIQEMGLSLEWRYYKDAKSWLAKIQKKTKTIIWMSIWSGYTHAGIYFPVRLEDQILGLDIQDSHKDTFRNTKNVGKTRPFNFEIGAGTSLADLKTVAKFKIKAK